MKRKIFQERKGKNSRKKSFTDSELSEELTLNPYHPYQRERGRVRLSMRLEPTKKNIFFVRLETFRVSCLHSPTLKIHENVLLTVFAGEITLNFIQLTFPCYTRPQDKTPAFRPFLHKPSWGVPRLRFVGASNLLLS